MLNRIPRRKCSLLFYLVLCLFSSRVYIDLKFNVSSLPSASSAAATSTLSSAEDSNTRRSKNQNTSTSFRTKPPFHHLTFISVLSLPNVSRRKRPRPPRSRHRTKHMHSGLLSTFVVGRSLVDVRHRRVGHSGVCLVSFVG
jgi:hypothetical protein